MTSIHLVAPLNKVVTNEDLCYIWELASSGFILEPDCSKRWELNTEMVCDSLIKCGLGRAATDFRQRQQKLAEYRRHPHRVIVQHTERYPGGIINDALEFVATDGLSKGRFYFKCGVAVAQGWQDAVGDDLRVINAMLIAFCGRLSNCTTAFVEDTNEYIQWLNKLIDSFAEQKIINDSPNFI